MMLAVSTQAGGKELGLEHQPLNHLVPRAVQLLQFVMGLGGRADARHPTSCRALQRFAGLEPAQLLFPGWSCSLLLQGEQHRWSDAVGWDRGARFCLAGYGSLDKPWKGCGVLRCNGTVMLMRLGGGMKVVGWGWWQLIPRGACRCCHMEPARAGAAVGAGEPAAPAAGAAGGSGGMEGVAGHASEC